MQMVETRNVSWSIILHALVLLIAVVGLPALLPKKPDPEPLVMSVELLPISEVNNVKPSDQPIQKAQNAPAPTKPTPTPPTPKAQPAPPPPPPPPKETFDPDEGAEVKDKIKPVEKPPEPPKPTIDQKSTEDFNKILADMKLKAEKEQQKTPPAVTPPAATPGKDKTTTPENATKSDAPYNDAIPMSMTETNSIRDQIEKCWSPPIGAKDANTLIVKVHIVIGADGSVTDPKLDPSMLARYNSDTFFRAAADAAVRATERCNLIKNLPAEKYNTWHETEVTFDPSSM